MITLTEKAAKHVQKMLDAAAGSLGMRITLKQAGCTGFKYLLDVTDRINETDAVFESQGIKVIIEKKNVVFLDGTELDYVQQGINAKMVLNNPHVEEACGCGESFTFKE